MADLKKIRVHEASVGGSGYVVIEVLGVSRNWKTDEITDSWLWLEYAYTIQWASPKLVLLVALMRRFGNIRKMLGCGK